MPRLIWRAISYVCRERVFSTGFQFVSIWSSIGTSLLVLNPPERVSSTRSWSRRRAAAQSPPRSRDDATTPSSGLGVSFCA